MPSLTIKGRTLFYEEKGEGFPLLFGHSYLWDGKMWEPQVEALSSSYRCIVPDLWAHGRSNLLPEIPYSLESIAEDHWLLARALGLERFAVVGLSVGGMWGVHLTLKHPEAVAALVLMDTYVGPEPEEKRLRYFGMLDTVEKAGAIPAPLAEAVVPLFFSPVTIQQKPDFPARFKASLTGIPADRIPSVVAVGRAIFSRSSVLDRLAEIHVPTLVMVGADDLSRPPFEAEEMARLIPGARLEVIPEAGHISTLEQPERVTSLIRSFLEAVLAG